MSRRAARILRAKARFAMTRAVLVLAAIALLFSVVRAGTRFFYCPMTHLVFDESPCASSDDDDDHTDGPAVKIADCCEERWRGAAPTASTQNDEPTKVAPPSVFAIVSPVQLDPSGTANVPFGIMHAVRAGPTPPEAGKRRAQLMVFHI